MGTLVFSDKFTKFHQEFEKVIKNRSKIFYGLSVVFSRMSSDIFFFAKSPMGIPLDSIFFTQIFFSVTLPSSVRYLNQNLLLYDERPSYLILWKQGNFYELKLLWSYNGLKFNFERFSRLRESRSKVIRNWLETR